MRKNPPIHRGKDHHKWNGGQTTDRYGYIKVLAVGHPMADSKGYAYKHRLVMSESIGRLLSRKELVHHIDEDRTNNSLDNLEIVDRSTHASMHSAGSTPPTYCKVKKKITCLFCKVQFIPKHSKRKYCSKRCSDMSRVGKTPKNIEGLKLGWVWMKGKTHNRTPKGKDNWNYIERPTLVCELCGKEYKTIVRRHTRRFCSSECRYKWCSMRMKTDNPMKKT